MLASNLEAPSTERLSDLGQPLSPNEIGDLVHAMTRGLGIDLAALQASTGLSEHDLALRLSLIAMSEAEQRIERQQQRIEQLESLSITDELTGLLNRRGFRMQLSKAIALVARGRENGLLVMVDLDGFKGINDRHGHAAGDEMLITIAAILREAVRETDTVARLGGDEFAILMLGASRDDVRDRLAAVERDLNGRTFHWRGAPLPIRASMGAVALEGEKNVDALLDRADARMYERKRSRRRERPEQSAPRDDASVRTAGHAAG